MSQDTPSSRRPAEGSQGLGGPYRFDPSTWDDAMPVPVGMNLVCNGCGRKLDGLDRRTCPDCGRRFDLPIPEELELRCHECGYALTGLMTRICPECGTGFDIRGLLFAKRLGRRHRLRDRFPVHEVVQWTVGIVLGVFGFLTVAGFSPCVAFLATAFFAGAFYSRGMEPSRIALYIGLFWGGLALLGLVLL